MLKVLLAPVGGKEQLDHFDLAVALNRSERDDRKPLGSFRARRNQNRLIALDRGFQQRDMFLMLDRGPQIWARMDAMIAEHAVGRLRAIPNQPGFGRSHVADFAEQPFVKRLGVDAAGSHLFQVVQLLLHSAALAMEDEPQSDVASARSMQTDVRRNVPGLRKISPGILMGSDFRTELRRGD